MIVLVGFMGAGKSTVGPRVARKMGLPFLDTDALIEGRAGSSVSDIFRERGEPAFRELEREVVLETLSGPEAVVALGGGALSDPRVAQALEGKQVVYLDVSYPEARRRVGEGRSRPMWHQEEARALYERRRDSYERLSQLRVTTDHRTPEQVAASIAVATGGRALAEEELRRVLVPLEERSYEIVVGRDLMARLDSVLPPSPEADKAFLVTHDGLDRFAKEAEASLSARGLSVERLRLAEGEPSKSLEVVAAMCAELAARGAHKRDLVVSMGGGVVCDVAGFCAAVYNRGMPLIHIPTTLLAQVDAAIGGKCGVNIPAGKNLIGTIYQPLVVICDVDLLNTLPEEEFRSGMAEVIKYGLIADPDLLVDLGERYRRIYDGHSLSLVQLVSRSAAIKASFVAADEHDRGKRAFLNYGHTFAHAIETLQGFSGIRHGEAVSLGMMAAAYLSHELGRLGQDGVRTHRDALESVGLPVTVKLDIDRMEEAWQHDKKYVHGVRFVLLNEIGRPEAGISAHRSAVAAALQRLAA
jgi:shikimate kinase / 3-dehydroquinate synthase